MTFEEPAAEPAAEPTEPVAEPAPESAIDQPPEATPGPPRSRWGGRGLLLWVASGVVALAAAIGVVLLISGRSAGLDPAAGYVPADAVAYMEVQLDLPGKQRAQLRTLLERFPAVNADDVLGPALADTLDEALASGNAPVNYSEDLAPWFTGHVAAALNTFPSMQTGASFEVPSIVFLFGTRDAEAAKAALDKIRGYLENNGLTFSSSDHDGVTLWVAETPATEFGIGAVSLELAVTADQVVLGVNGGAKSALDVHAGRKDSLAKKADLGQLVGRLPQERVAALVVDSASILHAAYPQSPLPSAIAAMMANAADLAVASLSFEADAVRLVAVSGPFPNGPPAAKLEKDLAAEVPGDALFFLEGPGFGDSMGNLVDSLKASAGADPSTAQFLDQLQQFESFAGFKLEDYFDWAGGIAMAAGAQGTEPWGGIIFEVSDRTLAGQRVSQLDTLIALAAADPSSGIEVTRRSVAGTQATQVRITVDPSAGLPFSDVVIEYALTDDRLIFGFGDGFLGRALDLAAADSLAKSETYGRALTAVSGDPSRGVLLVDIAAIRTWAESQMPPDVAAGYNRDVAPNLKPLDYLVLGSRVDGDFAISTLLLKLT